MCNLVYYSTMEMVLYSVRDRLKDRQIYRYMIKRHNNDNSRAARWTTYGRVFFCSSSRFIIITTTKRNHLYDKERCNIKKKKIYINHGLKIYDRLYNGVQASVHIISVRAWASACASVCAVSPVSLLNQSRRSVCQYIITVYQYIPLSSYKYAPLLLNGRHVIFTIRESIINS